MKIKYKHKTIYKFTLTNEMHNKSINYLIDKLEQYALEESSIDLLINLKLENVCLLNKGIILDINKTFKEYNLTNNDYVYC